MRNSCQNRREGSGARRTDPEEAIAKIQAVTEEMTMHRYVHSLPAGPVRNGSRRTCGASCRNSIKYWTTKIKFWWKFCPHWTA